MNIADICRELKNWFDTTRYYGNFEIRDGIIDLSELVSDGSLQYGQYFRIIKSVFNDGVYQYTDDLTFEKDERFYGAVWTMAVPNELIALVDEINDWFEKYADTVNSPYQSESFGGYTYSKANNGVWSWQKQFASRLDKWRKI